MTLVNGYRPFDPDTIQDPYPQYEWLREHDPVRCDDDTGMWVVSRYDDVLRVLRDPAAFSSALGMGDLVGARRRKDERPPSFVLDLAGLRVLIATDPPDHTTLRRLVSRAFTPREIAALEPRIRELANAMVDDLIDAGTEADLVAQLAYPLPVIVIAELLGIPADRRADFKRWSDDVVGGLSGTWDEGRAQYSGGEMFGFFADLIDRRTREPEGDLISLLATRGTEGDVALGPMEIVMFCVLLLIAGNETTTNLIGNGVQALFDHPQEFRKLSVDPGLIPSAVEEALRYDAPVQALFRGTTRDVELAGTTIPAGDKVMVSFASANRDPRRFDRASEFIVDRNPADHVAFGAGIHLCLGAPLARLEARVTAEVMLERLARLEPTAAGTRVDSFLLRGFSTLPVHAQPK